MAIYAELPNGTRLEFPNNTKQSVMDSVVKKQLSDNPHLFIHPAETPKNEVIKLHNADQPITNITSKIVSTQTQQSHIKTQPKTFTPSTISTHQQQISVSPSPQNNNYIEQPETGNSIYVWIIAIFLFI